MNNDENTMFKALYEITVKPNVEELSFFWSYPYSGDFFASVCKDVEEVELEDVKAFKNVPEALQYAFYVWCIENNKL